MMSLETINAENKQKADEARESGVKPYLFDSWDMERIKVGDYSRIYSLPNIGDYEPPRFKVSETYFVDTSGFGTENELALPFKYFVQHIKKGYAYAIVSVEQFQVYINEYKPV